ncbi:MAG: universal stress protein [Rhodobacteraceae bacterium]|nr:universal stress protein [Paracoccaceae bacterium]
MHKHILVAVDLTHREDAAKLVAEAGRLAKFENANLHLVTVLPDYGMSFVGSFFQDGTLKAATAAAHDSLRALADDVLTDHGQVQCIVEIGSVYEKTLKAAKLSNADLIVVGAHKPDLADRVMGPNAARIARHANVSVQVVRF